MELKLGKCTKVDLIAWFKSKTNVIRIQSSSKTQCDSSQKLQAITFK